MKISVVATTHENYIAPKSEFDSLSGHSAGVCYMPHNFDALFGEPIEKTIRRCENTKINQHHSVFGHPYITLSLEDIPKGLAMILNNEGAYNTSEKSARYTKMILKDNEQKLYNKWLDIYKNLIRDEYQGKYPQIFTPQKVEKLAQENARYLISVFTPTSMIYTVSYQQLNYLYQMFINEINNQNSNAFIEALKPAMQDFCYAIETHTGYTDKDIARGVDNKNRKLSLIGSMIKPEQYFGDVYSISYEGTFAQLAQAQRHRTIDYNMTLLDEPKFYVPPIIRRSDELTREWISDCEKQASVFPQGLLININEFGRLDWFIQKMKERKCTFAQLEIAQQTDLILKKYVEELRAKGHPRAEELAQYTKGARCTFPDYKCPNPCGFKEGINETRLI
ncbi:MAG: FAD-dependent thymidylate synthase [Clostridia bacterium]|nr:FAD-dependent thymidylate synthase [Clostridia bacterium]